MMSEFAYDKIAVGKRIQEKRLSFRLTQEKVAERLDISLRFVTEIERGAVGMSIETLLGFCQLLKTTPDALLLSDSDTEHSSELEWLIDVLEHCDKRQQDTAIDILRAYLRSE